MSRSGASAEDDAGWDAIGEKDGVIGYEAVLTDQRRQRRRIEHGTDEGQKGVRRGMVCYSSSPAFFYGLVNVGARYRT